MNWGFNEWGESTKAEMRERSGPSGSCPVCPEGTFQQNKWMGLETWANSQQPFTTLVIITSVVDHISCFFLKTVYDPKTSTCFPLRGIFYNCTVNFKILFLKYNILKKISNSWRFLSFWKVTLNNFHHFYINNTIFKVISFTCY